LWYDILSELNIIEIEKGVNMAKCDICGKGVQFGHNVSHSKKATNRQWKPNIQKVTITKDGVSRRMKVCAKCLKTLSKT
jgi:large subunit ribosomal protein L28